MIKIYYFMIFIISFIFIIQPKESFSINTASDTAIEKKSEKNSILLLRIRQDISLYDLITKSGYKIEDNDVEPFLKDFLNINKSIKGISNFKKGTIVKLPLKNLKKVSSNLLLFKDKIAIKGKKEKLISKDKSKNIDNILISNTVILRNIKILSQFLDDKISVETEGIKLFNINDKSEILFNTSYFPVINLSEKKILIVDFNGILPNEIKNIIEMSWPEYRIITNSKQNDLKAIVYNLLEVMGYSVSKDQRVITGGRTQLQYNADFLIFKNNDDILNNDISFVSIIGINEFATPESIIEWLRDKGINVVELSFNENKRFYQKGNSKIVHIDSNKDAKEFTETILSLLGYKYTKDNIFDLSDRKEYNYNFKADLSIKLGYKTKIIEFADFNENEISYAKKRGFDIICLEPWEAKKNILSKIMSLLSLNYKNSPNINSSLISQKEVKYRLISPGIFVHSIYGPVFITDSDFSKEMLGQLVDERITTIVY